MTRQHHAESQDGLAEAASRKGMLSGQHSIFTSQCSAVARCILSTTAQEIPPWHVMAASSWLKGGLSAMQTCCVASFSGEIAHAAHNGGSIKEDNSSRAAEGKGSQQPEGHLHDALCCRPDCKIPHKVHCAPASCNESAQEKGLLMQCRICVLPSAAIKQWLLKVAARRAG